MRVPGGALRGWERQESVRTRGSRVEHCALDKSETMHPTSGEGRIWGELRVLEGSAGSRKRMTACSSRGGQPTFVVSSGEGV